MIQQADRLLLLVEHDGNTLSNASRQLMALGREQADRVGAEFVALVLGHKVQGLAQAVATMGADVVYVADAMSLAEYNPPTYIGALLRLLGELGPKLILLSDSLVAREIGPAVAFRLGIPFLSNCIGLELSRAGIAAVQPKYGGATHVKVQLGSPAMVCLQPGLDTRDVPTRDAARIVAIPVAVEADPRVKAVGITRGGFGQVDLARAEIIVAGGRGLGKAENITLLRDLAAALGGVIACSRPLCDLGWLPPEHLVGMSGKTVSPRVYIACGISGAPQHVVGMKDARCVIAINKDGSAPIFGAAHYGVVGDLFKIVPAVIAEARKALLPGK